METRKVTIINNKTQSQKVIQNSKATTLGELKKEMREAAIDYSGMTFFEGHLRAELKDNASILPSNIPYKGQVVNDLIFMLSSPEKKIKSGSMTRPELYAAIKANNLKEKCVKQFGKNFTQCSTQNLINLLASVEDKKQSSKVVEEKVVEDKKETLTAKQHECKESSCTSDTNLKEALIKLIKDLGESSVISASVYTETMKLLGQKVDMSKKIEKLSSSEIEDMFDFIKD